MQRLEPTHHLTTQELYTLATDLLVHEDKETEEVKSILVEKGLSDVAAHTILQNVQDDINKAKKDDARKDMLYGALWCVGGTVATLTNMRFVFWGFILFGSVQFIKGLINYFKISDETDSHEHLAEF
jgi:hypothetical protein